MMANYTFITEKGETATVYACDMDQARILAIARNGRDYLWAKLTKITAGNAAR